MQFFNHTLSRALYVILLFLLENPIPGYGRSHHQDRKPVTWTMTSKHLVGKAADIISHSRAWSWPEFYAALKEEAKPLGLTTIKQEGCHVQWGR